MKLSPYVQPPNVQHFFGEFSLLLRCFTLVVQPMYIHYVFAIPNFRGIPWSHKIFRLLKVKRQAYMAPFIIRIARKFGPPIQIVEKSSSNFKNYCFIVYNIRKKSLDNCERLEIQLSSDDFLMSVHLWFCLEVLRSI